MKAILVSEIRNEEPPGCHLTVDDYVPVRLHAYDSSMGVAYLRCGDFRGSLLEFMLDPGSWVLRGFTLTVYDKTHAPRNLPPLPTKSGLPAISIPDKSVLHGPPDAQRIDIRADFSVGLGSDFLEIDLGDLSEATLMSKCGPVEFFINADYLVGLRVVRLSADEISVLQYHHHLAQGRHLS